MKINFSIFTEGLTFSTKRTLFSVYESTGQFMDLLPPRIGSPYSKTRMMIIHELDWKNKFL